MSLLGIRLSDLGFTFLPASDPKKPEVDTPPGRYFRAFPEEARRKFIGVGEDRWNDWWDGDYGWGRMPVAKLLQVFTPEELVRLHYGTPFMSEVSRWLEKDPARRIAWKAGNSLWRWSYVRDFNLMGAFYNALKGFSFGEGFEVRLDSTVGSNMRGYPVFHRRVYLDGIFGFIVYRRGEPVLVIGFSMTPRGVIIQQVQLLKKRGNRWLYKLPEHHFSYSVRRMLECFGDLGVHLIDGRDLTRAIRASYANGGGPGLETLKRVRSLYERPLSGIIRGEAFQANGLAYYRLEPECLTARRSV